MKGQPLYPNKSKAGSYWITRTAWTLLKRAARRSGKSDSDIIEHCLRAKAEQIDKNITAI